MTKLNKTEIKNKLASYVARYPSQNTAANTLKNVSPATVSQILNDKWEKIAEDMWRNVASQIGITTWQMVETRCYKLISETLADAQQYANVYAVTATAGSGKSFTADYYTSTHANAYHITCCEWWSPKTFFCELLRSMGLEAKVAYNDNAGMLDAIVKAIKKKQSPLLILDEADKLADKVLYSFITLYNMVEDVCGIVMMATENLEMRITAGVRGNRRGYNEVYSRLGRRFIAIKANKADDVEKVCIANGVVDRYEIDKITSDCEFDLRRVKRFIHSHKILNNGTGN